MALTKRYDTIDGRIRSESTGGTRTGYLPDALGSVTATTQAGAVVNTYRYKPYGTQLAKTGGAGDPKFLWIGQWGYRSSEPGCYVRMRHYSMNTGNWNSQDPVWLLLEMQAYGYRSATVKADPSGLSPEYVGCDDYKSEIGKCCDKVKPGGELEEKVKQCMKASFAFAWPPKPSGQWDNDNNKAFDAFFGELFGAIMRGCSGQDNADRICIRCAKSGIIPSWSNDCPNPCESGSWAYSYPSPGRVWRKPEGLDVEGLSRWQDFCGVFPYAHDECLAALRGNGKACSCGIVLCFQSTPYGDRVGGEGALESLCAIMYHELSHCSSLGHKFKDSHRGAPRELDFVYKLGCCICKLTSPGTPYDNCGVECDRLTGVKQ
jgi:RHS repeat-associated protein